MIWKREDENMLKSKKRVRGESKKIRVADSTVKLIDKELQSKLKIKLPLDENAVDILAEYFEAEETRLAQDRAENIAYDRQYLTDICRASDDFSPSGDGETTDIDDLNNRLAEQAR